MLLHVTMSVILSRCHMNFNWGITLLPYPASFSHALPSFHTSPYMHYSVVMVCCGLSVVQRNNMWRCGKGPTSHVLWTVKGCVSSDLSHMPRILPAPERPAPPTSHPIGIAPTIRTHCVWMCMPDVQSSVSIVTVLTWHVAPACVGGYFCQCNISLN